LPRTTANKKGLLMRRVISLCVVGVGIWLIVLGLQMTRTVDEVQNTKYSTVGGTKLRNTGIGAGLGAGVGLGTYLLIGGIGIATGGIGIGIGVVAFTVGGAIAGGLAGAASGHSASTVPHTSVQLVFAHSLWTCAVVILFGILMTIYGAKAFRRQIQMGRLASSGDLDGK
jgi:hypothetical protein